MTAAIEVLEIAVSTATELEGVRQGQIGCIVIHGCRVSAARPEGLGRPA